MSHFTGLVIKTPEFNYDVDEMLEAYSEIREVPYHYIKDVSNFDKVVFCAYYTIGVFNAKKQFCEETNKDSVKMDDMERYVSNHEEEFADWYEKKYGFENLKDLYTKFGEEWNCDEWRYNPFSKKWEIWSTYNYNSKYDYYQKIEGVIIDKYGNSVSTTKLSDLVFDHENKRVLFDRFPVALIVDGIWGEYGKVGWFGSIDVNTTEEEWQETIYNILKNLDEESELTTLDFHI